MRVKPLFLWLGLILALCSAPARADIGQDVAGLAAKGYKAKGAAVERLAASGDARAVPVLRAYLEQRLFRLKADDRLVIGEKTGKVYALQDPLTLAALGQAGKKELKKIRINNKLRGVVRGALGRLSLLNPDRDKRRRTPSSRPGPATWSPFWRRPWPRNPTVRSPTGCSVRWPQPG